MATSAIKNRTREEVIAAVKEMLRRRHEWVEQAQRDFKRIRAERAAMEDETQNAYEDNR